MGKPALVLKKKDPFDDQTGVDLAVLIGARRVPIHRSHSHQTAPFLIIGPLIVNCLILIPAFSFFFFKHTFRNTKKTKGASSLTTAIENFVDAKERQHAERLVDCCFETEDNNDESNAFRRNVLSPFVAGC